MLNIIGLRVNEHQILIRWNSTTVDIEVDGRPMAAVDCYAPSGTDASSVPPRLVVDTPDGQDTLAQFTYGVAADGGPTVEWDCGGKRGREEYPPDEVEE